MAKQSPKLDLKPLIGVPLERAFKLKKDVIDVATRTAKQVAITSDEPILHWVNGRGIAYVILDHAEKSINLERFKGSAPFLENHNPDKRLGRSKNPLTNGSMLRADIRFSSSNQYQRDTFDEVQEDLEHGDSPGTSTGFTVERIAENIESYIDGIPVVRAIRWTPFEVSLASMEADLRTGFGRCIGDNTRTAANDDEDEVEDPAEEATESDDVETAEEEGDADAVAKRKKRKRSTTPTTRTKDMTTAINPTPEAVTPPPPPSPAQLLQARTTEFVDTAAMFGETDEQKSRFRTMARTLALDDAMTLVELKRDILAAMKTTQQPAAVISPDSQGAVSVRRYQSLKVFKGAGADERAYRFGMAFLANACAGAAARGANANQVAMIKRATDYCRDHGLLQRAGQVEGINEDGGFTVQEEWSQDFIDLREQYGVIRRNTKIEPMAAETKTVLRRTGGLRFYAAGEEDSVTTSKKTWDRVGLVAKKWLCMGKMSSEITEDSIINQADDLASEMAYAAALLEDDCGFNGDGTGDPAAATGYQGITGILAKLLGLSATRANIAGLVVGSGNLWSELVLADFEAVVGQLPQYADTPNAKWFAHRTFYFTVMKKLLLAQTGASATEASEMRQPIFLGYPVEFAQVLPKVQANDAIPCVFGDLRLGSRLGNRSDLTIMLSEHSSFSTDAIDIRGRIRFDFVTHDVGNASGTANLRVPGPIVGLLTAAS